MARTLIVSDRHNSFFTANNIRVGNQLPTEGNYVKGDIIVNIGESTATEAMWICVESGNPGVWEVVGAGAGAGSFVSINDSVFVNEPVNEVSLAGLGVGVSSKDKLIVHHNSVHLMEGVDYEISKDGTKIVKLTEGNWNEDSEENALFAFELFKGVESVEGDKIVVDSKLTSITNHVILESGVSEVEIGINGFNAENDMMLVFKNGVNMVEGVDYEVQGGKIVSTGEVWNENGIEDYGMTFVVFKEVAEYNGDAEVKAENIADGSIGMDKLADDVKGAIEEASNIDLSGYVEQEEYNGKIAELEGKVNEAFTSANNGKQLIANAIGEPVSAEDTFSAMSNDINGLLSTFKTNMMKNGITVESNDRFKQLIDNIATMVEEGVGKGIQMTSDEINSLSNNTYTTFDGLYSGYVYGSGWNRCNYIELSLNFTPTIILVQSTITTSGSSPFTIYSTTTYDNFSKNGIISKAEFTCSATANNDGSLLHFSPKIENGKYILPVRAHNTNYPIGTIHCTWLAIGVGEEDTTLRDSLASILQEEGVSVTEEDDMSSLITKVDEEFTKDNNEITNLTNELAGKVTPAGTAVAGDVLSGKTFINNTGQTITGTMAKMSTHTEVAEYVAWNENSIYLGIPAGAYVNTSSTGYPEVYIGKTRLDKNLVPENIVSGKSICGVAGSANTLRNLTKSMGYFSNAYEFTFSSTGYSSFTVSTHGHFTPSVIILHIVSAQSNGQHASCPVISTINNSPSNAAVIPIRTSSTSEFNATVYIDSITQWDFKINTKTDFSGTYKVQCWMYVMLLA